MWTWRRLLRHADRAVAAQPDAGFSTLAGACVGPAGIAGGVSGDSAIVWACRDQAPQTLLSDQSQQPAVGSGRAHFELAAARLCKPWTVVLMSDGVWKYTGLELVVDIVTQHPPVAEIVDTLRQRVSPGGIRYPDDFTLLVLQNTDTNSR